MNSRTALWATLLLALPAHAAPLDRAVILSGGGSTFSNHYSQYLQTRLLTDHMRTRTSPDQVDVFFGAGNSETSGDPFPDVHRLIHSKEEGEVDEFLPGTIPGNRMADKDTFLGFVRKELKKKAKEDGNLFLFVTDHGMPNQNKNGEWDHRYSNNCINLWEQDPETLLTASFKDSCLSVNELKKSLKRTPKKKLVFVMTQCFSGGFHGLSVQSDSHGYVSADRNVCGFSSTTEDTTASGCTPDVDDSSYQGYERHFAEALSGIDVVTGEKTGAPAQSVRDAHYEAARIDRTKDIPLSTSEFYLKTWSENILKKDFVSRAGRNARGPRITFEIAMDGYLEREQILKAAGDLRGWFEFQYAHLDRMIDTLSKEYPELNEFRQPYNQALSQKVNDLENEYRALEDEEMKILLRSGETAKKTLDPGVVTYLKHQEGNSGAGPFGQIDEKMARILSLRGIVRRIQLINRNIAMAYALISVKDTQAVEDFKGLLECENTGF